MHQYSHHNLPQPFSTFFTPISSVHERFTRAKTENKLYIPKFSTARSQKSFKYQGAKIWNSIPTEIKQLTFNKFKIEYKKKLLESYFNRLACFWPKGYQLGSLGKSHQNGDYLKQAMRKIVFPQESNLQPLDYRSTALISLWITEQWTGNPKAAGSIPVGRQFFALLVLSSRRSGGSSLGFRAGSL